MISLYLCQHQETAATLPAYTAGGMVMVRDQEEEEEDDAELQAAVLQSLQV